MNDLLITVYFKWKIYKIFFNQYHILTFLEKKKNLPMIENADDANSCGECDLWNIPNMSYWVNVVGH